MPAYLVVTLTLSDPEAFNRYRQAIDGLETRWGGLYLVRAPVLARLEGEDLAGERVVIMEFPDAASAQGFIASDAYQNAKRKRLGAAVLDMRLVEGV